MQKVIEKVGDLYSVFFDDLSYEAKVFIGELTRKDSAQKKKSRSSFDSPTNKDIFSKDEFFKYLYGITEGIGSRLYSHSFYSIETCLSLEVTSCPNGLVKLDCCKSSLTKKEDLNISYKDFIYAMTELELDSESFSKKHDSKNVYSFFNDVWNGTYVYDEDFFTNSKNEAEVLDFIYAVKISSFIKHVLSEPCFQKVHMFLNSKEDAASIIEAYKSIKKDRFCYSKTVIGNLKLEILIYLTRIFIAEAVDSGLLF